MPIPLPGEKVDETRRDKVERAARFLFRRAKGCIVSVRNRKIPETRDPIAEKAVASFIALGMISKRAQTKPATHVPERAGERKAIA